VERIGIDISWNDTEKLADKFMSNIFMYRDLQLSLRNYLGRLKGDTQQLKEDIHNFIRIVHSLVQ
jgi:hypothetical protein